MVNSGPPRLSARIENWPIAGSFAISRGAKTEAVVVVAELSDGPASHRARRMRALCPLWRDAGSAFWRGSRACAPRIAAGMTRQDLQSALPPGAARNALDCAFWDFEAKSDKDARLRARRIADAETGHHRFHDLHRLAGRDGDGGEGRRASPAAQGQARTSRRSRNASPPCARAAPKAELIVDANEGWNPDNLAENLAACAARGRDARGTAPARRRRRYCCARSSARF